MPACPLCPSRRRFLRRCLAATAVAGLPQIVTAETLGLGGRTGPNSRITVATLGVGPQGSSVMRMFLGEPQCRVAAVCDVNALRREDARKLVNRHYGKEDCAAYRDFREVIARNDIDAVHVATPDHWHVPMALAAARAGKDMYIEKPLGLSVAANQALREAVHAHGNVFQFGTQHRSERNFRFGCELVRNGRIGKVHTIRVGSLPSLASETLPPMPVPEWLDYELWLGPAPWAPYHEKRIVNRYWWHTSDYSLGFVAGYGVHYVDIAQWGNGTELSGPVEVEGSGEFPEDGLCDCATAWDVTMTYPDGVKLVYTDTTKVREGITFEGDGGTVYITLGRTEAEPARLNEETFRPGESRLYESNHHVRNFLDCVRARRPTICPIDVAVRSDTLCHLSDIAMRLGRRLRWDPQAERFLDDPAANAMLTRAMREPWRL
jgi:predicted dehydrogenase